MVLFSGGKVIYKEWSRHLNELDMLAIHKASNSKNHCPKNRTCKYLNVLLDANYEGPASEDYLCMIFSLKSYIILGAIRLSNILVRSVQRKKTNKRLDFFSGRFSPYKTQYRPRTFDMEDLYPSRIIYIEIKLLLRSRLFQHTCTVR